MKITVRDNPESSPVSEMRRVAMKAITKAVHAKLLASALYEGLE